MTFLRNRTILYAFYNKFATFSDFERNSSFFPKKIHLLFQKNPNFERFEKSYNFIRILRQIFCNSVKKIHVQRRERTS